MGNVEKIKVGVGWDVLWRRAAAAGARGEASFELVNVTNSAVILANEVGDGAWRWVVDHLCSGEELWLPCATIADKADGGWLFVIM